MKYISGDQRPAYCGQKLETAGTYKVGNVGEIFFEGKIILQDGGRYESLGIDDKHVQIKLVEDALIFEENILSHCGSRKLVTYYIPYPMF